MSKKINLTQEEKLELAEIIANAVLQAMKEDGITLKEEELHIIAASVFDEIQKTKHISDDNTNCDILYNKDRISDCLLIDDDIRNSILSSFEIFGRCVRIIDSDTIRWYSSGRLKDYSSSNFFINRLFSLFNFKSFGFKELIKSKPAYYTYIEFPCLIVNPFFITGENNILSILLDIKPSELNKIIHYQNYVVTNSCSNLIHNKQILSEIDYLKLRDRNIDMAVVTGGEAIKFLLESVDLKSILNQIEKKYKHRSNSIPKKIQKRVVVLEYLIENNVDINSVLISFLPVPQVFNLLCGLSRDKIDAIVNSYLYVSSITFRINNLYELGAPSLILNNLKSVLQKSVGKLFKKLIELLYCDQAIYDEKTDKYLLEMVSKDIVDLCEKKQLDISILKYYFAFLLGLDICCDTDELDVFFDFLNRNNTLEDMNVWDNLSV